MLDIDYGTRNKEIYYWESMVVTGSYLVHYDTLLQNATVTITKCNTFITKCDSYCKMRRFYCKLWHYQMQRVLQNVFVHSTLWHCMCLYLRYSILYYILNCMCLILLPFVCMGTSKTFKQPQIVLLDFFP